MCGAIPPSRSVSASCRDTSQLIQCILITHLNKRADVWSNPALPFGLCQLQGHPQPAQCILTTHLNKRADVWSNPALTFSLCQLQGHPQLIQRLSPKHGADKHAVRLQNSAWKWSSLFLRYFPCEINQSVKTNQSIATCWSLWRAPVGRWPSAEPMMRSQYPQSWWNKEMFSNSLKLFNAVTYSVLIWFRYILSPLQYSNLRRSKRV